MTCHCVIRDRKQMNTRPRPPSQIADPMSAPDMAAVLERARALKAAVLRGPAEPTLRGKKLGLLYQSEGLPDAALFGRAALRLGAHVAYVRSSLSAQSTPLEVTNTARLLGRLYDAVECQGMLPALVQRIEAEAGVPVYCDLASPSHSTAHLAMRLGAGGDADDDRCLVVQAVLLMTIA